jgi:lysophospholipase
MDLIVTAKNPIPGGAVTEDIVTEDGVHLRTARWEATAEPHRGTVCLFQGRAEFIEKYFEVISDLRRRGFAVATLDWRGQGGSQLLLKNSIKGHVRAFRDFDRDLEAFMRKVVLPYCPRPYYALAHSMGGHILLRHATAPAPYFDRIVLTAPMVDITRERLTMSRRMARTVCEAACFAGFASGFTPGGARAPVDLGDFEDNPFTHDAARFDRTNEILKEHPELGRGAATFGWLRAALRSISRVTDPDYATRVKVPILLFAAGQDTIASTPAAEDLAQRLKLGQVIRIPDARHEILMETDAVRRRFWAGFDAYLGVDAPA